MIKHIVMWKFKDEYSLVEKQEFAEAFRSKLEILAKKIDGVEKLELISNVADSSNMDIILISEFRDEAVLETYQNHPEHVAAGAFWKDKVALRSCIDYQE